MQAGSYQYGLTYLKQALQENPNQGQYWISYIGGLVEAGETDAARQMLAEGRRHGLQGQTVEELAHRLLQTAGRMRGKSDDTSSGKRRIEPGEAEQSQLMTLFAERRYAEIEPLARSLTLRFPNSGLPWKALGVALKMMGRHVEALAPMRQAASLRPQDHETYFNLGEICRENGLLRDAEEACRKALAIEPRYAEAHNNLANILGECGRLGEAEAACRQALAIRPDYAKAHNTLANVLKEQHRFDLAEASYRRAVAINPGDVRALNHLARLLRELDRVSEAEAVCRQALSIDPAFAEALVNLADILGAQGRLEESIEHLRHALRLRPDDLVARSSFLFHSNYAAHPSLECFQDALEFGRRAGARVDASFESPRIDPAPPKRLRVGLLSGDFGEHPVSYFLESVLAHLSGQPIDLIAYVTRDVSGSISRRLRACFLSERSLLGVGDAAAAAMIRQDDIHILIDLSGHTAHNRLPIFSWRPAPVQLSWLGYFATTGLPEMDYLLADKIGVPPEQRSLYTESIRYLPETRLCFTPPEFAPPVAPLPALVKGHITAASFQALPKINDEVLALWGRILESIPTMRLRLQNNSLSDPAVADRLRDRLRRSGIDPARVEMYGAASREAYLAAYAEVDLVFDTFPYPGGTTTCEALWMGVPTVTLAGETLLARQGASLMTAAGLPEWIASDPESYVAKAIAAAGDLSALAEFRIGVRSQVCSSPLFDAARFAKHFEAALWNMWRDAADCRVL